MTIQCCVCKKTKVGDDWRPQPAPQGQEISHTYCPSCLVASVTALTLERAASPGAGMYQPA